jgi:hypothetical protein
LVGREADRFVKDALCFCFIIEGFLLQEVFQMLEKVVISGRQV